MKKTGLLSKGFQYIRSLGNIFKTCFALSWNSSKFYTFLRIAIKIISALTTVAMLFITKNILNVLVGADVPANPEMTLIFYMALVLTLRIANLLISKLSTYINTIHNEIVENSITVNMMNISVQADMEFFDSTKYYDAFEAVGRDIRSLTNALWFMFDSIQNIVTVISATVVLCQISALIPVIIIAATIPATIVEQKYTKTLYQWSLDHIVEERKLNYLHKVMTNKDFAPDIRLHNIGSALKQRYKNIWNAFFKQRKALLKKRSFITAFMSLLPEILVISMMAYLAVRTLRTGLTIGDYSLYTSMLEQLVGAVYVLTTFMMHIYESKLRIDHINLFKSYSNKVQNEGKRKIEDRICIEFKNVKFSYPDTDQVILEDVSFTIEAGEKVCLIGVNGAGKSTIVKLLLRFYDVDAGEILINGYNIKEYEINNLRKSMSCLFQKYVNYAFTLKDNIAISDLSKDSVNMLNVLYALSKGDCQDILTNASKGFDTCLTKDFDQQGLELSGGQQQKIAIARLFYERGNMIILDEPSAALDPEAEYNIFQAFDELCRGKTALFTSHRLTNVHLADKILVLESGRIIEQGAHEELMKNPKRYSVLYKYQLDKFKTAY
ncbi:MAG: ABC transporter ATP-binding protein [Christensenellales bacterium]